MKSNDNPLFQQSAPVDDPSTGTVATPAGDDAAVRLIREKVARAYAAEPSAIEEIAEVQAERTPSKHQRFMQKLSGSGKSLAEIQTEWHHYYTMLPDDEKHEVWQEFYAANTNTPYQKLFQKQNPVASRRVVQPLTPLTPSFSTPSPEVHAELPELTLPAVSEQTVQPIVSTMPMPPSVPLSLTAPSKPLLPAVRKQLKSKRANKLRSKITNKYERTLTPESREAVAKVKQKIVRRVTAGGKLKAKHHLQSLLFGLSTGGIVLVILLFSFFNQYVIAPFIQPSRTVSATPIILSDASALATSAPQVLIPKINVQIPLDFGVQTNNEADIETALEGGVVHYPSTVHPGENGNAAFFGHSSNNIFNPGKYKFAFVLLHTLTTGDVFYLTYNGKAYAYQVFAKEIVPPSQVDVLSDTKGKQATATLITCDPPGTSTNRLVVWGEQISPAPSSNTAGTTVTAAATTTPTTIASNGPTLWNRFTSALEFWK